MSERQNVVLALPRLFLEWVAVAGLALLVGFVHFKNGIQSAIEDYSHGLWRKGLLIATTSLSYTAAAVAIFALIRLAL